MQHLEKMVKVQLVQKDRDGVVDGTTHNTGEPCPLSLTGTWRLMSPLPLPHPLPRSKKKVLIMGTVARALIITMEEISHLLPLHHHPLENNLRRSLSKTTLPLLAVGYGVVGRARALLQVMMDRLVSSSSSHSSSHSSSSRDREISKATGPLALMCHPHLLGLVACLRDPLSMDLLQGSQAHGTKFPLVR